MLRDDVDRLLSRMAAAGLIHRDLKPSNILVAEDGPHVIDFGVARAIDASREVRAPEDLAPHLPALLWLYQMGLILYWIYDRSPGQRQTRALREKSLALVVAGLKMARFALLKPLRKKIVELIVVAEGGHDGARPSHA